jgi:hypothetical protein
MAAFLCKSLASRLPWTADVQGTGPSRVNERPLKCLWLRPPSVYSEASLPTGLSTETVDKCMFCQRKTALDWLSTRLASLENDFAPQLSTWCRLPRPSSVNERASSITTGEVMHFLSISPAGILGLPLVVVADLSCGQLPNPEGAVHGRSRWSGLLSMGKVWRLGAVGNCRTPKGLSTGEAGGQGCCPWRAHAPSVAAQLGSCRRFRDVERRLAWAAPCNR